MAYCELSGSPREGMSESGGNTAERVFLSTWNDRLTTAAALAGTAYPGLGHCVVQDIQIQPFSNDLVSSGTISDPASTLPSYQIDGKPAAVIRVSYGPSFFAKAWPSEVTKPSLRAGTSLRLRIRFSGQFLTFPARTMKWSDGGSSSGPMPEEEEVTPPDMNARILIPTAEYNLQWDFVDNPPIDTLRGCLGRVNNNTYLGAPSETLLFEGFDVDDAFRCSLSNPHTYRINVVLRLRRIITDAGVVGWNHDYREDPPGWQRVEMQDGENRYDLVDLSGIFN